MYGRPHWALTLRAAVLSTGKLLGTGLEEPNAYSPDDTLKTWSRKRVLVDCAPLS